MASPLLELKNIDVGWGSSPLLKNISFQVREGEAIAVIGPSGQGKSSLLKTIAGLLPPLKGQVFIKTKTLYDERGQEDPILLKSLGMLFQKNALFDSMSVIDNIRFPLGELTEQSADEISATAEKYLYAVGLLESRDQFPSELSGGMQKRLGIARAIALKPELTLYDDPTAGLDPITSRKIINLIISLRQQGAATSISVVNDIKRVYQLASRVLFLCDGELLDCGSVDQLKTLKDKRVQQFIHGRLEGPLAGV